MLFDNYIHIRYILSNKLSDKNLDMYGYQYNGKGRGQIYSLFKISESAHNDKQE